MLLLNSFTAIANSCTVTVKCLKKIFEIKICQKYFIIASSQTIYYCLLLPLLIYHFWMLFIAYSWLVRWLDFVYLLLFVFFCFLVFFSYLSLFSFLFRDVMFLCFRCCCCCQCYLSNFLCETLRKQTSFWHFAILSNMQFQKS